MHCVCTYVCMYVCVCVCLCVEREREGERGLFMRLYSGEVKHCALCRSFVSFGQWNFCAET